MPSILSNANADFLAGGGEVGAMIRTKDWSQTPLGPIEAWPDSLRMILSVALKNRLPMSLWWGRDLIHLYNDAYRYAIAGDMHPQALGARVAEVWPELWEIMRPRVQSVLNGDAATCDENLLLKIPQDGFLKESYFTFSHSPVPNGDGAIGGLLVDVQETTQQVQDLRQFHTLRDLAAQSAQAKTVQEACGRAALVLQQNSADIPFALLYLVEQRAEQEIEQEGLHARLVATAGMEGYVGPGIREQISLHEDSDEQALWPLAESARLRQPVVVKDLVARAGEMPPGQWSDAPQEALCMPLAHESQAQLYGFLVTGLNPHRKLNERYRDFLGLVAVQVVTAVANASAYENEQQHAELLSRLDRQKSAVFSNVSHEVLRHSAQRLRLMMESITDFAIITIDTEGFINGWNRGAQQMFGYTAAEAIGQYDALIFTPEDRARNAHIEEMRQARTKGRAEDERWHLRKDGTRFYVSGVLTPLWDSTIIGYVKVARDLTGRKQMEDALRDAKEYAESIVRTIPDSLLVLETDLRVKTANDTFYQTFQARPEETEGHLIFDLGNRQWDIPELHTLLEEILPEEKVIIGYEIDHTFEGIGRHTMLLNGRRLDQMQIILLAIADITGRKEAEEAVQRLNESLEGQVEERTKQVRNLVSQLTLSEQSERRRISQILHDDLQQRLYGLQFQVTFLRGALGGVREESALRTIREMEEELTILIQIVRSLSVDLSPPILYNEGLTEAIGWLASQMERQHGLAIKVQAEGTLPIPDEDLRVLLFQIVRELLFNIVKHAGVSSAVVSLAHSADQIRIEVRDQGRGFDASRETQNGQNSQGLLRIRQRLQLIGGSIQIETVPGSGTRAILHSPLRIGPR
jgi:PAS domain S-box-containing protein